MIDFGQAIPVERHALLGCRKTWRSPAQETVRSFTIITTTPNEEPADPVRLLFIDTWTRFDAIVQRAAAHGLLGNRTLEFLSFISAGDALIAFDQAAPALGMRISAQDLPKIKRILTSLS